MDGIEEGQGMCHDTREGGRGGWRGWRDEIDRVGFRVVFIGFSFEFPTRWNKEDWMLEKEFSLFRLLVSIANVVFVLMF